jgi:hypothetical protein
MTYTNVHRRNSTGNIHELKKAQNLKNRSHSFNADSENATEGGSNILERGISERQNISTVSSVNQDSESDIFYDASQTFEDQDSESDIFYDASQSFEDQDSESDIFYDASQSFESQDSESESNVSNDEISMSGYDADDESNYEFGISETEIQKLSEKFRKFTNDKQGKLKIPFKGKGRTKSRGHIFSTIDKLLDDFAEFPDREERNNTLKDIVLLCDVWLKKHNYTIISNPSYKTISEYLEQFKAEIELLKNRPLSGFKENIDLQNGKREKNQKKAEKLIKKYNNYIGTPSKFFDGVSSALDLMSPDTGDKSKFEMQLRFPVHPGVFVGGRVTLSAERKEDDEFKTNFEGTFQAGGTVHIAAFGGELGTYFECIAKDGPSTGKLLNYGLYRRFRESHIVPSRITNKLWSDSFGKSGYEKSEKMAAQIEQDVFGEKGNDGKFTGAAKKSHIEMGTTAAVIADFGVGGVGTGKGAAQYFEGKRISQFSLDQTRGIRDEGESQNMQGTGVGINEFEPNIGKSGPQRTKGQGSHRVQLANSGSFAGIGTYSIKLKLDLCSKPGTKFDESKVNKWEIELDGGASIPAYEFARNPGLAALPIAVSIAEASRSMWANYQGKHKTKSQVGGAVANPVKDLTAQLTTAFTASAASYKVPAVLGKDQTKFAGAIGLGVNFKCGQEAKPDEQVKGGKANLESFKAELALQKTSYTGIKFLDSEVKLETAKRIAQWKWREGGKTKLEFYPMTWEKEYNKNPEKHNTWGEFKRK